MYITVKIDRKLEDREENDPSRIQTNPGEPQRHTISSCFHVKFKHLIQTKVAFTFHDNVGIS